MAISEASCTALLRYVRVCQCLTEWRSEHSLPSEVAGWLSAKPGEPTGSDGRRPFGAVVEELDRAVTAAGLPYDDQVVLRRWFGLNQYPASLTGPDTGLLYRLAKLSSASRGRQPLGKRGIQRRRAAAVRVLAATLEPRPAEPVGYRQLPPAWREPWVGKDIRTRRLEQAFDIARGFLAISEPSRAEAAANRWHNMLDELYGLVYLPAREFPGRLAPANAVLAIGLWRVWADDRRSDSPERTHRSHPSSLQPRVLGRSFGGPELIRSAPAGAAPLLRGRHDADSIVAAAESAFTGTGGPMVCWPIFEICLDELDGSAIRRDPECEVTVLSLAARYARAAEDWRTVLLAARLVRQHPSSPDTIRACVDASVVAGAHHRYDAGLAALDWAERLLPGVVWPGPRDPQIERVEWQHKLKVCRTAVLRRKAETEVSTGGVDRSSAEARAILEGCLADVERLPDDGGSPGGDGHVGYRSRMFVRSAELRVLAAMAHSMSRGDKQRIGAELSVASRLISEASGLPNVPAMYDPQVPLLKLDLGMAVVGGDPDQIRQATHKLLEKGWPLERSVLPIFLALGEHHTGRRSVLNDQLRRGATIAIEAGKHWEQSQPDQHRYQVPVGQRRRQMAALS